MIERRPALGKGLSALIPEAPEPARTGVAEVDIDLLAPNQQQPRLQIDEGKLDELAQSNVAQQSSKAAGCRCSGARR